MTGLLGAVPLPGPALSRFAVRRAPPHRTYALSTAPEHALVPARGLGPPSPGPAGIPEHPREGRPARRCTKTRQTRPGRPQDRRTAASLLATTCTSPPPARPRPSKAAIPAPPHRLKGKLVSVWQSGPWASSRGEACLASSRAEAWRQGTAGMFDHSRAVILPWGITPAEVAPTKRHIRCQPHRHPGGARRRRTFRNGGL